MLSATFLTRVFRVKVANYGGRLRPRLDREKFYHTSEHFI